MSTTYCKLKTANSQEVHLTRFGVKGGGTNLSICTYAQPDIWGKLWDVKLNAEEVKELIVQLQRYVDDNISAADDLP